MPGMRTSDAVPFIRPMGVRLNNELTTDDCGNGRDEDAAPVYSARVALLAAVIVGAAIWAGVIKAIIGVTS